MRPNESLVCTAPPSRPPILHAHLDHARRVTRAVARGRVDRRFFCPVHDGQHDRRTHRHLCLGHRPWILGRHPDTESCCRSAGRGNRCRHRGIVAGTGIRGDGSGEHEFATDRSGSFGTAWLDVDQNGCDTRNDILARDLTGTAKSGKCRVMTGTLPGSYTGKKIHFVRGTSTSSLLQIDHVVALSNAWQPGAQQLCRFRSL